MKLRGSLERHCLPSILVSALAKKFSEKQGRVQLNDFLKVMSGVGMLLQDPESE